MNPRPVIIKSNSLPIAIMGPVVRHKDLVVLGGPDIQSRPIMLQITHIRQTIVFKGDPFTDRAEPLRVAATPDRVPSENSVFANHDRARPTVRIHLPLNVTKKAVHHHHFLAAQINRRIAPAQNVIPKDVLLPPKKTWHDISIR